MTILFLGPLPPPTHGFSAINKAMLEKIKASGAEVFVFNRSKSAQGIGKPSYLRLLAQYLRTGLTQKPSTLYAGFSGGLGQLLDLPFLVIANWLGLKIYIHHHSFAYLNQKSLVTRLCMSQLKNAIHIALCPEMAQKIILTYGIPATQCVPLSNAAFLDPSATSTSNEKIPPDTITVGFLSNITAEKGIFDFFSSLEAARAQGLNFKAKIAGPVAKEIQAQFADCLGKAPYAEHIGPVYGKEKDAFYDSIDVLLFPTRYVNEAEPVTIHEALRAGAQVVAAERGCIGGMLPDHCGKSLPIERFQQEAIAAVRALAALSPQQRAQAREEIKTHFEVTARKNQSLLDHLITQICR